MATLFPVPKLLRRRRTRIVATAGPASLHGTIPEQLIQAGVNIFRLNMSHGDHNSHRSAYHRLRQAAQIVGEPIAILADLCGPKIRVGCFRGGEIELETNSTVTITTREVLGDARLIPSIYPALANDVRSGDRILLDDGLLELRVDGVAGPDVICTVVNGGQLRDRKGMNLPGVALSTPALTEKDRVDAQFALELGVDLLALSFVRKGSDVEDLKNLVDAHGDATPIIAKIEKPEAMTGIEAILEAADGIMVARGDLGVELPPEMVPIAQQDLVLRARHAHKPVIVATQMLESMIENPRPTRAEVSDVSHAVFAGADAVMLSAETSVGRYPVQAVQMMDRVARQVEGWQWSEGAFRSLTRDECEQPGPFPLRQAVARSVAQLSRDLRVRAVVVRTRSGITASVVSATRPAAPIIALTRDAQVSRRLTLLWGVIPRQVNESEFEQPERVARRLVGELELAQAGEHILLLSGFREGEPQLSVLPV